MTTDVCVCVPGTGCVWIYSKKARWVEWERHSNSLHNTINMHYVIMHVQKQAAVPASNMVGKEAHTLLQAFKESASQELILLVNGKTAFTLMCVLVEAVVCACVCVRMCRKEHLATELTAHRCTWRLLSFYFHSWTWWVLMCLIKTAKSADTQREKHIASRYIYTVLENLLDYQKCFAGKNIHMVEVN